MSDQRQTRSAENPRASHGRAYACPRPRRRRASSLLLPQHPAKSPPGRRETCGAYRFALSCSLPSAPAPPTDALTLVLTPAAESKLTAFRQPPAKSLPVLRDSHGPIAKSCHALCSTTPATPPTGALRLPSPTGGERRARCPLHPEEPASSRHHPAPRPFELSCSSQSTTPPHRSSPLNVALKACLHPQGGVKGEVSLSNVPRGSIPSMVLDASRGGDSEPGGIVPGSNTRRWRHECDTTNKRTDCRLAR